MDIQKREDRIGRYFKKYLGKFVFNEFSHEFLANFKAGDLMQDVPIPFRAEELQDFAGEKSVSMQVLAENMTWVMGCDPHFKYTADYAAILKRLFGRKVYENILREGRDAAEKGELDNACIHFRAALCIKPDFLDAMYSYARVCRAMYLESQNEEYVGRFKAEALDYFELLTDIHPDFPQSYYYLGYAYLNMGLYVKAQLIWERFMELSQDGKDKKEIRDRLNQLEEPVQIEQGYNDIMSGRYEQGLAQLEPFVNSRFKTWWPLFYYLGIGYEMTGRKEEAVASFKKVLTMNASHLETMEELVAIYRQDGDEANIHKYQNKIRIIRAAAVEDQRMLQKEIQKEDEKLQKNAPDEQKPEHIEKIKKV